MRTPSDTAARGTGADAGSPGPGPAQARGQPVAGPSDTPHGRPAIDQRCPRSPGQAGVAVDATPGARPPFFDPLDTGAHRPEAVVECESRGVQRWASIVREGTPYGRTGAPHDFGLRVVP